MFSLNVNSVRSLLKGKKAMSIADLPRYAHEQIGLRALNLSTDLLKGMGRSDLEKIRDMGDKCGCSILMLEQPDALSLADPKEAVADQAVERMKRVIQAARLLGCNSVSVAIKSKDTDDHFDRAASRMREIMEVADSIDINVLIAPTAGLTNDPERVTGLIKGIGGFRIGTYPDFLQATKSGDPSGYLRKLTPYASVVNASTLEFIPGEPVESVPDITDDMDGLTGLDALAAELGAMDEEPAPIHVGYDLPPLVAAIKAVGFDGNIALDYRGGGDGTLGVLQSREAILDAIESLSQ